MNRTKSSSATVWFIACGTVALALTGCTTYVEHRHVYATPAPPPVVVTPTPPVVVEPAEAPVVVIQADSDFYEPLSTYGSWVVIGSYGRCWRPARVEAAWRPYCNGYWRRTDAGWYWASAEPWGWATYHYGRWDWSAQFGWFWVPHTLWAPAWVSWRHGAGYVGWAPLPPAARIDARGILEVREPAVTPRAYVFVSEQRLLEPVRPNTVIVNNTTIINETVNITKVQVVNRRVIAEGPQPEVIERKSGRKIEAVPVRQLRHREETEVVARQKNIATAAGRGGAPAQGGTTPANAIPARGPSHVERPTETRKETPQPLARPEARPPARNEVKPEQRPATTIPSRPARPVEQPSAITRQPQPSPNRSEVRGTPVKPVEEPEPTKIRRPFGNARGRALQPPNTSPETQKPGTVSKSPPAAKRQVPVKGKPSPEQRGKKDENKERKKGGE